MSRADWEVIWHFALSINGYEARDGEELAGLEQRVRAMWDRSQVLPDDLLELRLTLFILQRQHRFWGWDPDRDADPYIRAIVAKIDKVSGGSVPGPHDLDLRVSEDELVE